MSKCNQYCYSCKDETLFTYTEGDDTKYKHEKEYTSKGWYCCDCDIKYDGRKSKKIEEKFHLTESCISYQIDILTIEKKVLEYQTHISALKVDLPDKLLNKLEKRRENLKKELLK